MSGSKGHAEGRPCAISVQNSRIGALPDIAAGVTTGDIRRFLNIAVEKKHHPDGRGNCELEKLVNG